MSRFDTIFGVSLFLNFLWLLPQFLINFFLFLCPQKYPSKFHLRAQVLPRNRNNQILSIIARNSSNIGRWAVSTPFLDFQYFWTFWSWYRIFWSYSCFFCLTKNTLVNPSNVVPVLWFNKKHKLYSHDLTQIFCFRGSCIIS